MREIKFRAYIEKDACMMEQLDFDLRRRIPGDLIPVTYSSEWVMKGGDPDEISTEETHPDAILMQYTGLTDKYGKEIYEGDVLGVDCNMVCDYTGKSKVEIQKLIVVWWTSRAAFTVYDPSSVTKGYWGYVPNADAYVIGNKYQNPELLTINQQP